MDSSPNLNHHAKDLPKQCETFFFAGKYPSSRRTASFSSCSSSLSPSSSSIESFSCHDDPPFSPSSPLKFSGVPFSWEHLPGIPKKHNHSKKKQQSSIKLLPLPPPTITTSTTNSSKKVINHEDAKIWKKNSIQTSFQRDDPFFAAMVKCSKDDGDNHEETIGSFWNNGAKVSRSISDRFGFISLYGSCKRTCAVSESLVLLPSSRRNSYQQVNGRSIRNFSNH